MRKSTSRGQQLFGTLLICYITIFGYYFLSKVTTNSKSREIKISKFYRKTVGDDDHPSQILSDLDAKDHNRKLEVLSNAFDMLWLGESKCNLSDLSMLSVCQRFDKEGSDQKSVVTHVWKGWVLVEDAVLTMVTQTGANKIDRIKRLLDHWTGPVSIAVYVAHNETYMFIDFWQQNPELLDRKDIQLHLVAKRGEFYPINQLRNVALNASTSKYVYLADVDFAPSLDIYAQLVMRVESSPIVGKQVLVVPAFEFPNKQSETDFPRSKQVLLSLLDKGNIQTFHQKFWPNQGCINFTRWRAAEAPYSVSYGDAFEPYVVMNRNDTPPYDESFVGRNGNKNSHLMTIWAMGFEFIVLPDVFTIHYFHHFVWNTYYFRCTAQRKRLFVKELQEVYGISKIPSVCARR